MLKKILIGLGLAVGISVSSLTFAGLLRLNMSGSNSGVLFDSSNNWDDILVPLSSVKVPTLNAPGWESFKKNGAGTSVGTFAYAFDKSTEEEIYFQLQVPHSWKKATDIRPHIHGVPADGDTGTIRFGLEYTIATIGGTFGNTSTIYTPITAATGAFKHEKFEFPDISMTNMGISTMINCRLFRDVANDNYNNDYFVVASDFHINKDGLGSDTELIKSY